MTLHLGDFKSDEIHAKLVDRDLVICAEYKEKPDENGHISHNIRRTYILPPNVEFDHLRATFSDDGTLVVCAQKKAIEAVSFVSFICFMDSYFVSFVGKGTRYRREAASTFIADYPKEDRDD